MTKCLYVPYHCKDCNWCGLLPAQSLLVCSTTQHSCQCQALLPRHSQPLTGQPDALGPSPVSQSALHILECLSQGGQSLLCDKDMSGLQLKQAEYLTMLFYIIKICNKILFSACYSFSCKWDNTTYSTHSRTVQYSSEQWVKCLKFLCKCVVFGIKLQFVE